MNKTRIAVVIPYFHDSPRRREMLKSVLRMYAKTEWPDQLIISEMGSAGCELPRDWPVRIVRSPPPWNRSRARNIGAASVNDAEFICFMDGDILPAPDFCRYVRNDFCARTSAAKHVFLTMSTLQITENARDAILKDPWPMWRRLLERAQQLPMPRAFMTGGLTGVWSEHHRVLGSFDERLSGWGEDSDYYDRLSDLGIRVYPLEGIAAHIGATTMPSGRRVEFYRRWSAARVAAGSPIHIPMPLTSISESDTPPAIVQFS